MEYHNIQLPEADSPQARAALNAAEAPRPFTIVQEFCHQLTADGVSYHNRDLSLVLDATGKVIDYREDTSGWGITQLVNVYGELMA